VGGLDRGGSGPIGGVAGRLDQGDRDPEAGHHAWTEIAGRPDAPANFRFHSRNFSEIGALAAELGLVGRLDGILLDLGVSSPQFDQASRGFSFANDGPLDMRMDPRTGESAAEWLARAKESEIADVLYHFGEERNSRRIARRVVETRVAQPIATTSQLAALIASVPGPRSHKIHPATRSFQAIRIFINQELAALEAALAVMPQLLAADGRLVVISFHSLEDRIVKRFIRDSELEAVGRYFPTDGESAANPRARSAVLRVARRTEAAP